jgi:hypothetical protein
MRVRFMGSTGMDRRVSQGSDCLRQGEEYTVLEIFCQVDGANKFRIEVSPSELPALFDSRLFEVSSDMVPTGWRIDRSPHGSLTIGPGEWSSPGFWEAFMDREEWAMDLYLSGRGKSLG